MSHTPKYQSADLNLLDRIATALERIADAVETQAPQHPKCGHTATYGHDSTKHCILSVGHIGSHVYVPTIVES